ncbi:CDC73-domain-containing protein [Wallemia mellicola]|nr:CDC73-domain-containing protein [Wallemia mellicola]
MDPLVKIRECYKLNREIKYKLENNFVENLKDSTSILIDNTPFNKDQKTKLYLNDEFLTLDILVNLLNYKDKPFIDYVKLSKDANIPFISALDRKSIIDYLTGVTDSHKYIQDSSSNKKRFVTNQQDREIVKKIKQNEIDLDDRLTCLRADKQLNYSSIQQSVANKLASFNKPRHQQSSSNQQKKPTNMSPIIIIPSSPTSLISIFNVKSFLSDATFQTTQQAKQSNDSPDDLITVYRTKNSQHSSKWYIINSVETLNKFGPDAWERVVAVFTTGQLWQFKQYKWSDPRDLFRNVKGIYMHYSNEPINANIRDWNVSTFAIDKDKRHTDKSLVSNFWRQLDGWIAANKPHLNT